MSNKACLSDTTFIGTREGWLNLAVVSNLYSRQLIGPVMSHRKNIELVQAALTMVLWRRRDVGNVIVHSDQGSSYV